MSDHRINLTLYKIDRVMPGDLDEFIDALTAEDQAARLAAERMTVGAALARLPRRSRGAGVDAPRREARLLLATRWACPTGDARLDATGDAGERFEALLARRGGARADGVH